MNETELENHCLDWFRECGWSVAHGPDIAPDSSSPLRRDYAQVVLEAHVEAAFSRINPHLPPECLEQVLVAVSKPESPDLIGIANELKQALKTYADSKGRGQPTLNAEEAYAIMLEKLDAIHGMFSKTSHTAGFDYSSYETDAYKVLVPTANYILGLEDGKKRFLDLVLAITKAYSLCGTLDQAKQHRKEIAFLSAVKSAITKFTSVDKKLRQGLTQI